ncbi:MAG TPA: MFS transporter [Dehalococcoidia bacterium]|nr:MFS transporter [Dehalococcoidia bacterium]
MAVPLVKSRRGYELSVLIVLWLGGFFLVNSFFGISIAIPDIQREFGTPLSDLQWLSIMGWVTMSTLSLPFGRLADMLGRRRVFIAGVTLYALGSGLTGTASNFTLMLFFRAIMSIGLAIAFPLVTALAAATFPPERRGWALGMAASSFAVGRAMGPILGGVIIEPWGWRAIFLSNLAVGGITAAAGLLLFRGIQEERKLESFDLKGTLSLLIAFPCLLIPITRGPVDGWAAPHLLVLFIISGLGMVAFIFAEMNARNPLIPLRYFANRAFSIAVAVLSISSIATFPIMVFVPLYLKAAFGLSSLETGLQMTPLALLTALFSTVGGRWSDRVDARYVAFFGLLTGIIGLFTYSRLGDDTGYGFIALALALLGISGGLFIPANQRSAFAGISGTNFGMIAAVLTSLSTATGAIGTTIAVAVQESRMDAGDTFAEAQQFTFLVLLPAMAISAFLMLADRRKSLAAETAPVRATS